MILRFSHIVTFADDLQGTLNSDGAATTSPPLSSPPHLVLSSSMMLSAFSWVCTASRSRGNRPITAHIHTHITTQHGLQSNTHRRRQPLTCRKARLAGVLIVSLQPAWRHAHAGDTRTYCRGVCVCEEPAWPHLPPSTSEWSLFSCSSAALLSSHRAPT